MSPVPELPASFRGLLKEAAAEYRPAGWRLRGTGLVLRALDGAWGQIVFAQASREKTGPRHPWDTEPDAEWPTLEMRLSAGACAPYLMRIVNHLEASRPPPASWATAHTRVCSVVPVCFARVVRVGPRPLEMPPPWGPTGGRYYIDADTAAAWLADALAKLVPATQALTSNQAIYEWLSAKQDSWSLRYAILLARHLGLDDDLAPLEERARNAFEAMGIADQESADRQSDYPQSWSHERFMGFVERAPR
jgi:hypothetical protein